MKPVALTPLIPAPLTGAAKRDLPRTVATTTLAALCAGAGIDMRVTGGDSRNPVHCILGEAHFICGGKLYVGIGQSWKNDRADCLRVMEVLAHSFHDYAARECVCGRGLFCAPKRVGRPPNGTKAMSAAERMARMRANRRAR